MKKLMNPITIIGLSIGLMCAVGVDATTEGQGIPDSVVKASDDMNTRAKQMEAEAYANAE